MNSRRRISRMKWKQLSSKEEMKVRLFNSKNIVFIFRYNIIARSIPFFFPSLSKTNSDKENYYCLDFIGVRLKTSSLRAFFFFQFWKEVKIQRVSHHFEFHCSKSYEVKIYLDTKRRIYTDVNEITAPSFQTINKFP